MGSHPLSTRPATYLSYEVGSSKPLPSPRPTFVSRRSRGRRSLLSRIVVVAALVFSCLIAAPRVAFADEAAAETLFQEGLAAMKRNDFAVACEAFAQSNKADPSPGTQINLAVCYEKQKKWASAWTWYRSAVGLAQQRGQAEREKLAEESAARIKPMIHYIVVSVKESLTDLSVKRDGAEVTIALGGKEIPLPIDPGEHRIEVSAHGKKPWSTVLQIPDNPQTERVEVPPLEDAPVDESSAPPAPPANVNLSQPAVGSEGSTQRTVGIVVAGAGVLTALAGVGVFILAKDQESQRDKQRSAANALIDPATSRPYEAYYDQYRELNRSANTHNTAAKNDQLIALILGGGAVVLVGVGATLYFTAPKAADKAATVRWRPILGPGFAGLGGTF